MYVRRCPNSEFDVTFIRIIESRQIYLLLLWAKLRIDSRCYLVLHLLHGNTFHGNGSCTQTKPNIFTEMPSAHLCLLLVTSTDNVFKSFQYNYVTSVYRGWFYVFVQVRTPPQAPKPQPQPQPTADFYLRDNFRTTWISFIFGWIDGPDI